MLTFGTYVADGDFAFNVGLPWKSEMGVGIVGVIPIRLTVAVWSPGFNKKWHFICGAIWTHFIYDQNRGVYFLIHDDGWAVCTDG